jgi:hypothetical protein
MMRQQDRDVKGDLPGDDAVGAGFQGSREYTT